jgi:hypothetical protein
MPVLEREIMCLLRLPGDRIVSHLKSWLLNWEIDPDMRIGFAGCWNA